MANLVEIEQWDAGIYQLETTDPVIGGPDGIDNLQAKQLANRTKYLKAILELLLAGTTVPPGIATENYVQGLLNLLDAKQSVKIATTANIALAGTQTIDGVALQVADRVLVKNQNAPAENGLYVVSGSGWTRAGDADASTEVTPGLMVFVEQGTLQGNTRWQLTTDGPLVLGTSALTFQDVTAGYAPLANFLPGVVLEVGRYIDFHGTTNANDYDVRFDAGTTGAAGAGAASLTCGSFTVTGPVYAPTAAGGTNSTQVATTQFVATATAGAGFPAGTRMSFQQTAAPTGWTKDTTHNNKALRLTSGAVSSGGTVDFSTAFSSRGVAGTVGETTLSIAQMPIHNHQISHEAGNPGGSLVQWYQGTNNTPTTQYTDNTGGGGSHSHTFTGVAIDMTVQYVDFIIAQKN